MAVGDDSTILWTEDEGKSWKRATTPPDVKTALRAVIFTGATTGVAVGHGGTILRTEEWRKALGRVTTPSGLKATLNAVTFTGAKTGWQWGIIARSCAQRMEERIG